MSFLRQLGMWSPIIPKKPHVCSQRQTWDTGWVECEATCFYGCPLTNNLQLRHGQLCFGGFSQMRKLFLLTLILLVSVGWAMAQSSATPGAPPDQSPSMQSPSAQPGSPAQPGAAQQPGMPSDQASQAGQDASAAGAGNSVEGCLGGSAGNFTIIDKSGVTYQLQLPAGADASKLNSHIGEEVRVTGSMANNKSADASAASSGAAGASGSQPSISVTKIDKVGDKCTSNVQNPPSSH
jgi:hypothetical protein